MSVSVKVGREGVTGPLVWDGRSSHRAVMHESPLHYAFETGDTVYTSGYSSIFPGDIPLGTVFSSTEEMGTSATLKISLFEDFRTLNYVIICKSSYFYEIKKLVEENAE